MGRKRKDLEMGIGEYKSYRSHGTGEFSKADFKSLGEKVIIEAGVLIFHPENITIGNNVYIGHNTILKGYFKNKGLRTQFLVMLALLKKSLLHLTIE